MVADTRAMLSCTGRARVCWYCTKPKTAPIKQTTKPQFIKAAPPKPPRVGNFTADKSGMTRSASPARDAVAVMTLHTTSPAIPVRSLLFRIVRRY